MFNRIRSNRKPIFAAASRLVAFAIIVAMMPLAQASEGGSHKIPAGAFTFAPGVFPARGQTAFMGYFLWVRANSLRGNDGKPVAGVDFRADLFAHAGRFVHTWDFDWHGFGLTSSANYLVAYAHTRFNGIGDHDADLTDFNLEPIIITRTFHPESLGTLKWMLGFNYWFPVGHYEPRGNADPALAGAPNPHFLANAAIHAHYNTGIIETAMTWRPVPKLQIDWEGYVGFNFTNHRTGYRSGNMAGTEVGATLWPFRGLPRLGVGAGGYFLQQFTDDHLHGVAVPNRKLTQIGVGPQAVYAFKSHWVVSLRWQHHVRSDNAANGDQFWVLFFVPVKL